MTQFGFQERKSAFGVISNVTDFVSNMFDKKEKLNSMKFKIEKLLKI